MTDNPYLDLTPFECEVQLSEVEQNRQAIVDEYERLNRLMEINTKHRDWLLQAMGEVKLRLVQGGQS